jgi:transposase
VKLERHIKELVESRPNLAMLVEPLLVVRRALREQLAILHYRLLTVLGDDKICRRLMTVPGIGPVVYGTKPKLTVSRTMRHNEEIILCVAQ